MPFICCRFWCSEAGGGSKPRYRTAGGVCDRFLRKVLAFKQQAMASKSDQRLGKYANVGPAAQAQLQRDTVRQFKGAMEKGDEEMHQLLFAWCAEEEVVEAELAMCVDWDAYKERTGLKEL